ncbi:AAA family ATPase [Roseomonas sp. CECT 9278]|uniref:AAA family ATPase n=1 Tax=Roseomonas sp. CECT 9278 TaxID=2845823 RepID=UPI001E6537C1|nr:AAA family ATPase [Roseomonas sp. CECT 9278]CAH0295986.1 hypothetical protein ROS9278_04379 [Roseomonas sp. CECT 9278]
MDPVRNPFAPGAGTPPPELAGRLPLLARAELVLDRIKAGRPEKSFIATGLRGVGKTVLLVRIKELAVERDFRVAMVEAREQSRLAELLVPHLRRLLLELDRLGTVNEHVKRGLRVLRAFLGALKVKYEGVEIGVDPETGSADSGDLESDLPEMFAALGRAAKARGTGVALLIDELQYLDEAELSALIMALHRVAQDGLPLLLVAAGLPQIVGLTGKSKSYAERLFDFPHVGPLAPDAARHALVAPAAAEGVALDDDALDEIVRITEGYPFFLQEWGYTVWNIAPGSPITLADVQASHGETIRKLDASFFRVRFDRLTPREKEYLRAMASLGPGPHRSGDIAELLKVRVQSIAPVRATLIRKGMVYSPAHGDTAFTVPLFDAFMQRTMPDWSRAA